MTALDLSPMLRAFVDALQLTPDGQLFVDGGNPLREIALRW